MGVDFYTCAHPDCGQTFPDCGDYSYCGGCGERFCCQECSLLRNATEDEDESAATCVICRHDIILDNELVEFLLEKTGLTLEEAEHQCREGLLDQVQLWDDGHGGVRVGAKE